MRRPSLWLVPALALPLAAACGGDDDGSTALEGIYEGSRTHNAEGCDSEGPPQVLFDPNFFVRLDSFLGEEFVSVVACDALDECRMTAADTDTIHIGEFTFDDGNDQDGWTGWSAQLQVGDASCMGEVFLSTMTGQPMNSVRIARELRRVSGVPLDEMGECQEETAHQQAEAAPCEELTVLDGAYREGI